MVSIHLDDDLNAVGRGWRLVGWSIDNVRLNIVSVLISVLMGVLLVAGVVGTTVTFSSAARMDRVWTNFDTGLARRLMLLSELRQHLGYGGLAQHYRDYILVGEPLTRQAILQDFARLREIGPAYVSAGASDKERTALATVFATVEDYEKTLPRVEKEVARRKVAEQVTAQVRIDDRPALAALDALGRYLKDEHRAGTDGIAAALWTLGTTVGGVMILTGLLLLALGLFFFWFIRVRIIRPLYRLKAVMGRLSEGDRSVDIPLTEKADEIGDMARTVLVFKESMIRADALEAEKRAADAELLARARHREHLTREFGDSATRLLSVVHESVGQVRGTAASVLGVAEETGRQSQSVAAAAQQAVDNVQAVASATEQLGSSGRDIGASVTRSAGITREAVEHITGLNATMTTLHDAAEKIGEIVTLIGKIAGQTNLLALNASIEAQRAGTAGKGFAVVASEVKALATQTTGATQEIAGQVEHIQRITRQAVDALNGVEGTIHQADEVVSAIAGAVEEQNAAISEIHRNINQAANGNAEVSDNIVSVSRGAEHTGDMASRMVSVVAALASEAETMKTEIVTFLSAVRAN